MHRTCGQELAAVGRFSDPLFEHERNLRPFFGQRITKRSGLAAVPGQRDVLRPDTDHCAVRRRADTGLPWPDRLLSSHSGWAEVDQRRPGQRVSRWQPMDVERNTRVDAKVHWNKEFEDL